MTVVVAGDQALVRGGFRVPGVDGIEATRRIVSVWLRHLNDRAEVTARPEAARSPPPAYRPWLDLLRAAAGRIR